MSGLNHYHQYLGMKLVQAIEAIEADAYKHGLSVNTLDPSFKKNIDVDHTRLNVMIDEDTVIKSFSIG